MNFNITINLKVSHDLAARTLKENLELYFQNHTATSGQIVSLITQEIN